MSRKKKLLNPENPFEHLSLKQIRFLNDYFKTGKVAENWIKHNKTSNYASAYVAGTRFLRQNKEVQAAFFERQDITMKSIADAIKDGLTADREQIYKGQVYKFKDPYARMKAAEIAGRYIAEAPQSNNIGNQVNVQINTDKGEFRVTEG